MDDAPRLPLDEIVAFVADRCAAAGDPGAMERLTLRGTEEGVVIFSVEDAGMCGASLAGYLRPGREIAKVGHIVDRILRQRSRERIVAAAHPGGPADPPWSIDMHVATLAMLRHAGIDPALASGMDHRGGPQPLKDAARGTGFDVGISRLVAGRACIALVCASEGRHDVFLTETTVSNRQQVVVRNLTIPEAMMPSLAGRALGEVVAHPVLARAEHVAIHRARMDGALVLELADERAMLAEGPVPADWMRYGWIDPEGRED